jgi:cytochrome c oxidase cbb3-type subunit III
VIISSSAEAFASKSFRRSVSVATGHGGSIVSRLFFGVVLAAIYASSIFLPITAHAQDASLRYKIYCSRCHGPDGKADGPDAATLKTHPRDFTDCARMSKISDDTMFQAIKFGGASVNLSGDMPSWQAGLGDDDIHALIKYVRQFCKQ